MNVWYVFLNKKNQFCEFGIFCVPIFLDFELYNTHRRAQVMWYDFWTRNGRFPNRQNLYKRKLVATILTHSLRQESGLQSQTTIDMCQCVNLYLFSYFTVYSVDKQICCLVCQRYNLYVYFLYFLMIEKIGLRK